MSEVDNEESEGGKKGGILKIILIVIGILVLIAGTAVGTLFITGFFDEKPAEEDPEVALEEIEAELEQTEEGLAAGPEPLTAEIEQKFLISYYTFADAFQVNLFGSRKIMQVKLGLSTYYDKDTMFNEEEGTAGWIPRHLVGIRAGILKSLRKVTEETMNTDEGQQELLEELRLVINESLEKYEKTTSAPIEEVYFTELIIQ